MARLFGLLVTIFSLAACSSGVSNSGAGAAGTNCGSVDLTCSASIGLESTSIDTLNEPEEGEEEATTLPASDNGTLTIQIFDPLGRFANVFQGATFETFDISYSSGQGGAPNLGTRRFSSTLTILLNNGTGSGSIEVPVADQVTKDQFRDQSSGSTVFPYVVTVRATGRDIATNSSLVVVARTNIEIGNFVDN